MTRYLDAARVVWLFVWLACAIVLPNFARADPPPLPIGYFSWDVTNPGLSGQFDIVNLTGQNSSGDEAWPVLTAVSLSSLSLTVHFNDGSSSTFADSYFTLSPDGYSFDGSAIAIGGSHALPTDARLTGVFGPSTVILFDSQTYTLAPGFGAAIDFRAGGLADGDLQLIVASPIVASVPEPGTAALSIAGLMVLTLSRRPWRKRAASAAAALCVIGTMAVMPASAAVKMSLWTAPSSGTAGSDYVNVTVNGVALAPGQTIGSARITLAATCGATPLATVPAASVKLVIGNSWRIQFMLPGTLGTGTYAVAMTGTASDNSSFAGSNCSQVAVTAAPGGPWTTLVGADWHIAPGGDEAYTCTGLQLTQDLYISAFHAMSPPGDFQRLLTVQDKPLTTGPFQCNGQSLGDHGVYMSGLGSNDVELPAGAAVHLRAGQYLLLNIHLFNNSGQMQTGRSEIQIRTIPAASMTAPTELQLVGTINFSIPSAAPTTHTYSGHCRAASSFDILALAPRMNALGNQIQLTRTSADLGAVPQVLLDTPYSVTVESTYAAAPPVRITVEDTLTASCRFTNTTGQIVSFGESSSDEQCFVGVYRSPPNTSAPVPNSLSPQPFYDCMTKNNF